MSQDNLIARALGSTLATVWTFAVGVVAAFWVLVASRSFRHQIDRHGLIASIIAICLIAPLVIYVEVLAARGKQKDARIAALTTELESAQARLTQPSAHDTSLFDQLNVELPSNDGALGYLRVVFDGKSWRGDELRPLENYYYNTKHGVYFRDSIVEEKRRVFHAAIDEFLEALAGDGFPVRQRNPDLPDVDFYEIKSPAECIDGYAEFAGIRKNLLNLRSAVLETHEDLVRTGRQRGL